MKKETIITFTSSHSYVNWDDVIQLTEENGHDSDKVALHIKFSDSNGMKDLHDALGRRLKRQQEELEEKIREEIEKKEDIENS